MLFGFNNLNNWGLVLANPDAPISILGLSPVPFMLLIGVVLGQAFFAWSDKRVRDNKTPLLALEVLDCPAERSAVVRLSGGGWAGAGGQLSDSALHPDSCRIARRLFTSVAIVPYALAVAPAAILSVRLYGRLTPRQLGVISFVLVAAGMIVRASPSATTGARRL